VFIETSCYRVVEGSRGKKKTKQKNHINILQERIALGLIGAFERVINLASQAKLCLNELGGVTSSSCAECLPHPQCPIIL
jgi:hypothetical protein